MASKIVGEAKVIACSWNDIKEQITPERYILQQITVVLLLWGTAIKNFEKRKI